MLDLSRHRSGQRCSAQPLPALMHLSPLLPASAKGAAAAIKQLVDAGYRVCVTHGNGPQVGMLALQDPQVGGCCCCC